MITRLFLLFLPTLALASMQIYLTSDYQDGKVNVKVHYTGKDISTISEKDMKIFSLNTSSLLEAVHNYSQKRPTDVYFKSPTPPFGDLFNQYGWQQVQRILQPISADILAVTSDPVIILKQKFNNNSTKDAKFDVAIHQDVKDTVGSHWYKKGDVNFDAKAEYNYKLGVFDAGAFTEFKYNSIWGEDYQKSSNVTIGSTSSLQILLKPGQTAVASLMATRTAVNVTVVYEAKLSGNLAVNYQDPYKGHHFWRMDINDVFNASGINNTVMAMEEVTLNYFWKGEVQVIDGFTGKEVLAV